MLLIYVEITCFHVLHARWKIFLPPYSSSLKILYCRKKHFYWLFFLDIAQEVGHVKEEDRRPHNLFQAEGISLLTKPISAHRYCNTGNGDSTHYSVQIVICTQHVTFLPVPGTVSASFSSASCLLSWHIRHLHQKPLQLGYIWLCCIAGAASSPALQWK